MLTLKLNKARGPCPNKHRNSSHFVLVFVITGSHFEYTEANSGSDSRTSYPICVYYFDKNKESCVAYIICSCHYLRLQVLIRGRMVLCDMLTSVMTSFCLFNKCACEMV
jgi:hypothetical protein